MADSVLKHTYTNQTDNAQLAQLGHVQELRRDYSLWSLASLCLCLMATWEALATFIATALTTGGGPCLFFNLYDDAPPSFIQSS
jgi:hypothetical protein